MAKSFESWEREELEQTFGLKSVKNHPVMTAWLSANEAITLEEQAKMSKLQYDLQKEISFWNEEEVKLFFINDIIRQIRRVRRKKGEVNSNCLCTYELATTNANNN